MNQLPIDPSTSKWEHYQLLILNELTRLNSQDEKMQSHLGAIHDDLLQIKTTMKIRATIFGFLAGGFGTFLGFLVEWMRDR